MLGVVDEPAEMAAYGPRSESPIEISTRSSGRPSSSAAIWASAVLVPVPMSWWPVTTWARPSPESRTHAYEGGPPPPYHVWLASPTPRVHLPSDRACTSSRRAQCLSARS